MDANATPQTAIELVQCPLYSIVSLMLALFGATYTSIVALRNAFDKDVIELCQLANADKETLNKVKDKPTTFSEGITLYEKIHQCRRLWNWGFWVPVVNFCLFAIVIALFVIIKWDYVGTKEAPGIMYRIILGEALIVNFSCGCLCVFALRSIKRESDKLKKHMGILGELNMKDIQPL